MMYADLPTRERRAIKSSLAVGWFSATGAGLSTAVNPTSIVLTEMGSIVAGITGTILFISAIAAIYGIARNRYRFEWVAGWVSAASFVPYSITIWSLTATMNIHWITASFISTIAFSFFVSRALLCAGHAAKLREQHIAAETITSALDSVAEEGEPRADGDNTG